MTLSKEGMAERFGAKTNGIKLESFIFDVFPAAKSMAVVEIDRTAEFSPVKNAPGSSEDSPDTARALLSTLHRSWLTRSGVVVDGEGLVEISPAVSYSGEGLEGLKGKQLTAPLYIHTPNDPPVVLSGVSDYVY